MIRLEGVRVSVIRKCITRGSGATHAMPTYDATAATNVNGNLGQSSIKDHLLQCFIMLAVNFLINLIICFVRSVLRWADSTSSSSATATLQCLR